MTEESDRMLMLLQELAALKELEEASGKTKTVYRKRRKEISNEMKQLAAEKKCAADS